MNPGNSGGPVLDGQRQRSRKEANVSLRPG
jgi:hypothetical protein